MSKLNNELRNLVLNDYNKYNFSHEQREILFEKIAYFKNIKIGTGAELKGLETVAILKSYFWYSSKYHANKDKIFNHIMNALDKRKLKLFWIMSTSVRQEI